MDRGVYYSMDSSKTFNSGYKAELEMKLSAFAEDRSRLRLALNSCT